MAARETLRVAATNMIAPHLVYCWLGIPRKLYSNVDRDDRRVCGCVGKFGDRRDRDVDWRDEGVWWC